MHWAGPSSPRSMAATSRVPRASRSISPTHNSMVRQPPARPPTPPWPTALSPSRSGMTSWPTTTPVASSSLPRLPPVPGRSAGVEAPGGGAITVSPVKQSADSVALGETVLLSTDISGENVGHVKFFAGFWDKDDNSIYVADTDFLEEWTRARSAAYTIPTGARAISPWSSSGSPSSLPSTTDRPRRWRSSSRRTTALRPNWQSMRWTASTPMPTAKRGLPSFSLWTANCARSSALPTRTAGAHPARFCPRWATPSRS